MSSICIRAGTIKQNSDSEINLELFPDGKKGYKLKVEKNCVSIDALDYPGETTQRYEVYRRAGVTIPISSLIEFLIKGMEMAEYNLSNQQAKQLLTAISDALEVSENSRS